MFDDLYAGLDFDQRVDFYHHGQHWTNRMILGDSLLVMTSLAEKEGLKGKVQMIYLDPPYGIKFGSNWQVSTRKRDVKDGKAEDATRQPEQVRAFRDTWQLGIHSYLAYLRDRLAVARELLTETGSIFVQIGDENVHLVRACWTRCLAARISCSIITIAKTTQSTQSKLLACVADYHPVVCQRRRAGEVPAALSDKAVGKSRSAAYDLLEMADGRVADPNVESKSLANAIPMQSHFRL